MRSRLDERLRPAADPSSAAPLPSCSRTRAVPRGEHVSSWLLLPLQDAGMESYVGLDGHLGWLAASADGGDALEVDPPTDRLGRCGAEREVDDPRRVEHAVVVGENAAAAAGNDVEV